MDNTEKEVEPVQQEATFTDLIEEASDRLTTEPVIFDRELQVYRDNVLKSLMDIVGKELARLTQLQREVLIRMYYKKESTYQLATVFGVTRQSIQKTHKRALETLQRRLGANPYFTKIYSEFTIDDPTISELLKIADTLDGI